MARYEHLPIYKKAFDLNLYIEQMVRQFSRYHKYTLGTELRTRAREVARLIMQANNLPARSREKADTLRQLREEVEQMKLTARLCKEVRAFQNFNAFQTTINHLIDLSKQTEGWLKSLSAAEQTGPESAT